MRLDLLFLCHDYGVRGDGTKTDFVLCISVPVGDGYQ